METNVRQSNQAAVMAADLVNEFGINALAKAFVERTMEDRFMEIGRALHGNRSLAMKPSLLVWDGFEAANRASMPKPRRHSAER